MKFINGVAVALVASAGVATSAAAERPRFSDWSPAARVEAQPGTHPAFNGPALDGCPFITRDGKAFYMASNRPGGMGGLDIWVARREGPGEPWGAPVNVGPPVNSADNDFCPTMDRDGRRFFFVSNRAGGCGGGDIYVTRRRPGEGFDPPKNVGCDVNSAADEASPMPLPGRKGGGSLFFSSVRPGGHTAEAAGAATGDSDLYVSRSRGRVFGLAKLVPGVNSPFEDGQPNLRRDGLELFFYSNRPGTLGLADLYVARRHRASRPWSTPVNLGPKVNSADGAETRPSLSWDGTTLYFGSTRPGGEGSADHYVTTRSRD